MLNWSLRYATVVRLLDTLRPSSVLDVGSGDHGLNAYWRDGLVVRTDLEVPTQLEHPGPFVVANALSLPCSASSFDVVLSLDMIEHLAPADRSRAVSEMCRVARSHVVVGFPCGAAARRADAALVGILRMARKPIMPWLEEHRAHVYPEAGDLAAWVPSGWQVDGRYRNDNVLVHTAALLADNSRAGAARAQRLAERVTQRGLPRIVDVWPAYRVITVLRASA